MAHQEDEEGGVRIVAVSSGARSKVILSSLPHHDAVQILDVLLRLNHESLFCFSPPLVTLATSMSRRLPATKACPQCWASVI